MQQNQFIHVCLSTYIKSYLYPCLNNLAIFIKHCFITWLTIRLIWSFFYKILSLYMYSYNDLWKISLRMEISSFTPRPLIVLFLLSLSYFSIFFTFRHFPGLTSRVKQSQHAWNCLKRKSCASRMGSNPNLRLLPCLNKAMKPWKPHFSRFR